MLEQIHRLFNNRALRSFLVRFRFPVFACFIILIIPQIQASLLLPGVGIALFGEFIQVWSFGSLDKNRTLAVKGPYLITRNPMYIGRFFLLLGVVLVTANIWLLMVFVAAYYFYVVNRVKREEQRLQILFGKAFETYCAQVNRFMPSLKGVDRKLVYYFRWDLFIKNNGHWNAAAVFSVLLLLNGYALFYK